MLEIGEPAQVFSFLMEQPLPGGHALDAEQCRRIERLGELWSQYAPAMNLTARSDTTSLHAQVQEALLLVALAHQVGIGSPSRWVDVGSGGGFPGLVVAATLDVELVLVEPRQRRAAFLDLALASIGRSDCTVVRARLEDRGWKSIGRDALELKSARFSCASSRATFSPERWLERARMIVEPGGIVFGHLRAGQPDPEGSRPLMCCDDERWSVRAYRV